MRRRGRSAAGAVVAVCALVAAAASTLTGCTSGAGTKKDDPLPVSATCTGLGAVSADVPVVQARLALLAVDGSVSSSGSTLTIRSRTAPTLTRLACGSFRSAVRPVITVAKSAFVSSPTVPPISSFPSTAAAYAALPEDEKTHLRARLGATDCSALTGADSASPMLACQTGTGGSTVVELLGPAIASSADVRMATVVRSPQWAWVITYDTAAAARLAAYTTAHNQASTPGPAAVADCPLAGAACAAFLAFVVDGRAITTPATSAPLTDGRVQISGNYTEGDARAYALRFGPDLPVPLVAR